jgi:hypothetical protein
MRKLTVEDQDAINSINTFISEIPKVKDLNTAKAWKAKVLACLQSWLGNENALTLNFKERAEINPFSHPKEFRPQNNDDNATILDQVRKYINANGVLKDTVMSNWFCRLRIEWAIFLATLATGIVSWVIIEGLSMIRTQDYKNLQESYDGLRDSLRSSTLEISQIKKETTGKADDNTNTDIKESRRDTIIVEP